MQQKREAVVSVWPPWWIFILHRSMVLALPSKVPGMCSRESGSAWLMLQYNYSHRSDLGWLRARREKVSFGTITGLALMLG